MNRRRLLQASAASALLPSSLLTAAGDPKKKLRHVSVGAGGKAWVDLSSTHRTKLADIVAICDVDAKALAKAGKEFPDAKLYRDWRVMFEEVEFDSANVSTPDHMHALCSVEAMRKGVHLYTQKPLTHTVAEARLMAKVQAETGVSTQMGIQHSSSFYNRITEHWLQEGKIGKVKELHVFSDKTEWGSKKDRPEHEGDEVPGALDWKGWLGVASDRPFYKGVYHPKNWRGAREFGTSNLGDMGCHILSPGFRGLKLGAPKTVWSEGDKPNDFHWTPDGDVHWIFPGTEFTEGDLHVHWTHGSTRPTEEVTKMVGKKLPKQGSIFVGTEGIIVAPHVGGAPYLLPEEKFAEVRPPKFEARNHYGEWCAKALAEDPNVSAHFGYGAPLTEAILVGVAAMNFPGTKLEWNAKDMVFVGHEEATKELHRESYRKDWEIEGLE